VWFSISKPENKIHGFVQYYFRPNMGMLNGGPVLWDPSGTYQWNCLYYNWAHLQALPVGAEKFNMTARNSLSVQVLEPLARYAISYDKDGVKMALHWEAIGPVHELKTGDAGQQKTAMTGKSPSIVFPCATPPTARAITRRWRAAGISGALRKTVLSMPSPWARVPSRR
jgi:hypothetical protein